MNVECGLLAEEVPGGEVSLWAGLDTTAHSGYRLRGVFEGPWTFTLERVTGGVPTVLASKGGIILAEESHPLKLIVGGGKLKALLDGTGILSAADATYTNGRVALEGTKHNAFGEVDFTVNGTLLDSLRREESPLSNGEKWLVLPWVEDIGYCFSAGFGWVPEAERSGAYWAPAEYGEEGETATTVGLFARGMVPRPLD